MLVPGTWHGGWLWQPVADELRSRGHRAYAITCTGVGERHHLINPDVGLYTHIADVSNLIEFELLDDVVLVGHSFGGITVTGVADALGDKIRQLIYYDAFIPTRQRPAWVMQEADGSWPERWQKRIAKFVDGYKMDFNQSYPLDMLLDPQQYPEIAQSVKERLTYHPANQWTEPVSFRNGGWEGRRCAYVHCVGQKYSPSSAAMWQPAKDNNWPFIEFDAPRMGMLTHTRECADILENLAV